MHCTRLNLLIFFSYKIEPIITSRSDNNPLVKYVPCFLYGLPSPLLVYPPHVLPPLQHPLEIFNRQSLKRFSFVVLRPHPVVNNNKTSLLFTTISPHSSLMLFPNWSALYLVTKDTIHVQVVCESSSLIVIFTRHCNCLHHKSGHGIIKTIPSSSSL